VGLAGGSQHCHLEAAAILLPHRLTIVALPASTILCHALVLSCLWLPHLLGEDEAVDASNRRIEGVMTAKGHRIAVAAC
jgi:hypothetical protein